MSAWCHWHADTLILELKIQPRARRDEVMGSAGGRLKVRITAPPTDHRANRRLLEFLAREFDVSKSKVVLLSGEHAREKRVAVESPRRLPPWIPPR